jgi:hypothetical protein
MSGMTDLGIANLALIELGQPPLAVADNTSKAGRLILTSYEPRLKMILRSHPWRCARRQIVLSADPDATPPFGFSVACQLPEGFLKVVKFNNHIDKFEIVGNHLQCDDDAPELTYIARVPTNQFDDGLVMTTAAYLAMCWCIAITDSGNKVDGYRKLYDATLADAKFSDALDGAPEEPPIGTWAEARLSG